MLDPEESDSIQGGPTVIVPLFDVLRGLRFYCWRAIYRAHSEPHLEPTCCIRLLY